LNAIHLKNSKVNQKPIVSPPPTSSLILQGLVHHYWIVLQFLTLKMEKKILLQF